MRLGFIVILVGVLYLLKNMGFINSPGWSLLWPIIVIFIGIAIVSRKTWRHGKWCDCNKCMGTSKDGCDCNCSTCKNCDKKS